MDNDLTKLQDELQAEAQQLIEKLGLIKLLSKYGAPTIVGSTALGLLVWRDLDIEVAVDKFSREYISEIAAILINSQTYRVDITFIDNLDKHNPYNPIGLYLGMKYFDSTPTKVEENNIDKTWKIDIWFLTPDNLQGKATTENLKNQLTNDNRKYILEIKNIVTHNPLYRKEIRSMDIYTAVLEKGVRNIDEFSQYLNDQGKSL